MATYIGFSTQDLAQTRNDPSPGIDGGIGTITQQPIISKKFKLVDTQLVLRDLLNAFMIKQGDIVGNPSYGTTLWQYVFDPNTSQLRQEIQDEVKRVASLDPRLTLGSVDVFEQENGVLIEIEMAILPFSNTVQAGFFLNRYDGSIQQIAL